MRLSNIPITAKLWGLVGVVMLALITSVVAGLFETYTTMVTDKRHQVRSIVEAATSIAADYDRRVQSGEMSLEDAQTAVRSALRALRYDGDEYLFAYDDKGINVIHGGKPELEGKDLSDVRDPDGVPVIQELLKATRGDGFFEYKWPKPGTDASFPKLSYADRFDPWGWNVGAGAYYDEMNAAFWAEARTVASIAGVFVVLIAIGAFFVTRNITKPLKHATTTISGLADGDTSVDVGDTTRGDEIGRMLKATDRLRQSVSQAFRLNQMVDSQPANVMLCNTDLEITYINDASRSLLRKMEKHMGVSADQVVGMSVLKFHKKPEMVRQVLSNPKNLPYSGRFKMGDLVIENTIIPIYGEDGSYIGPMLNWTDVTKYVAMMERFQAKVQTSVNQVSSSAGDLSGLAQEMRGGAAEAGQRSTSVAAAAEQAGMNVQTVASAAEELSASIAEIGRSVSRAADLSASAAEKMQSAQQVIAGLDTAATQIGDVVNLINDIASQTNLLALNATIEAARAGDAGKGFAVVANEVKSLAGQTAKATEDIARQIAQVQDATRGAVTAIKDISGVIHEVTEVSGSIASAVEEQNAATSEISRNINEASEGTTVVTREIETVASNAKAAEHSSEQVLTAAERLSALSTDLSKEVDRFLEFMEDNTNAA